MRLCRRWRAFLEGMASLDLSGQRSARSERLLKQLREARDHAGQIEPLDGAAVRQMAQELHDHLKAQEGER